MKTPRDILLEHHRTVAPKLDAVRQVVIGELNNQATKKRSFQNFFVSLFLGCLKNFWRELIFPCRRIWAGLAAIWILIFIVNFCQRDSSQTVIAKSSPSPEMMMTFRDQQKWLDELLADRSLPMDVEQPRIFSPKPRTEIMEFLTV